MFIFNGAKAFVLGGLGTRRGVVSLELRSEVNLIFTFVEGNLSTHLKTNTTLNTIFKQNTSTFNIRLKVFEKVDLRGRQFQWGSSTSSENTVNEDTIFAVTRQVKVARLVANFQVSSRNKT